MGGIEWSSRYQITGDHVMVTGGREERGRAESVINKLPKRC
jgi:hypothetical protein